MEMAVERTRAVCPPTHTGHTSWRHGSASGMAGRGLGSTPRALGIREKLRGQRLHLGLSVVGGWGEDCEGFSAVF